MPDRGEKARQGAEALLRARLELSERAHTGSMDQVLQLTVDEVEDLTGSRIGFMHFLEEDQRTLSLQSWSSRTLAGMCSAEGEGMHYPVDQAGVWCDCIRQRRAVIHNDYAALEHRRGMPPGHAEVIRELVVPVFRGEQIVAILGVGNKPSDYDEDDVEVVSQLANLAWDIVLHKRSEEALRQSERDLARAQQVAHVGSWKLDLLHDRLSWSDEIYRIFGLEPRQFGATLEDFLERVHPDDRPGVEAAYRSAVDQGTRYEIVHRVVRPDGEVRVVQERSEEERDEEGRAVRSLGTILDITELAETQERLRRLNEELEQRVRERTAELEASRAELMQLNEQKSEFLGMAAHELRNPLAVIQGFASVLEQRYLGPLVPEQIDVLRRIRASSDYMLKLVNDLLDVTKIEAGRLELRRAPEDLRDVVRDAVEASQPLGRPKNVSVELAPGERLAPVPVDRTRLAQVLNNLLHNAIKHSHPGSTVEVSVERGDRDAVLCVADHGRGIRPEVMAKLFRPFGTDGAPGTGGEQATGLGLAIARQMVEAHGGRIWAESKPGAGSRFFVALPLDGAAGAS